MKDDLITRYKKAILKIYYNEKGKWECGMKNDYFRAEDITNKLLDVLGVLDRE